MHAGADMVFGVDAGQNLRSAAEQRLIDAPANDEEREMLCGNSGFGYL